jgi:hypothetical protein
MDLGNNIKNMKKNRNWKSGDRSFNWSPEYKETPLCLQSREYNRDMKGVTWVYYSEKDAKRLLKFLKKVFK